MKINLLKIIQEYIYTIIISSIIFGILSIFIAKSFDNIYESKSLLYATDTSDVGRNNQAFSITSILSETSSSDNSQFASKMLFSRDFFEIIYQDNKFASELMAYSFYDSLNKKNIFNEEIYDLSSEDWVSEKPPLEFAHKVFISRHFIFYETSDIGFFELKVRHKSPVVSKNWSDLIIKEINQYVGSYKEKTANQVLNFLLPQLAVEKNPDIKLSMQNLITKKYQDVALTKSEDYVFSVISRPYEPIKKSSPNRALICFAITFMGFILTFFVIILKDVLFNNRNKIV